MEPGELILIEFYLNMTVNRPIPWVGMPVCFEKRKWFLVEGQVRISGGHSYACFNGGQNILSSYINHDKRMDRFSLPGEPEAPPMVEFTDIYADAYEWGKAVKCVNGIWVSTEIPNRCDAHTALILPAGVSFAKALPNNGAKPTISQDLKKLNTDGRSTCARCGKVLAPLWIGNTNLSYCQACEG